MLQGKVIVITGASSGIGAQTAILLASYGAIPVLLARSKAKLEKVGNQIKSEHALYEMDVTSTEQVNETVKKVLAQYGKIDILINNAGFAIFESFQMSTLKYYEEMMSVNFFGLVRCTQAVLPSMIDRNQGHIINIASIAGKVGVAKSAGYVASKHAVIGFTNSLRQDMISTGENIYVSILNPGPVKTAFFDIADPSGDYLKNLPDWFVLEPEKVAKAVLEIIIHKKTEKSIPRIAGFAVWLMNVIPLKFDKLLHRFTNNK